MNNCVKKFFLFFLVSQIGGSIAFAQIVIDRVQYFKFSQLKPTSGTYLCGGASIVDGERSHVGVINILPEVSELGSNCKTIEYLGNFQNCKNLKKVIIPNTIKFINESFRGCDGLSLELPNSVIQITGYSFYGCGLVNIPDSVIYLGQYAYSGCGIREANIPKTVITLKEGLFEDCKELEKIVIPWSVKTIEKKVFAKCTKVCEVVSYIEPINIDESVFDSQIYANAVLRVPNQYLNDYKNAPVWRNFQHIEGFKFLCIKINNASREYGEDNPAFSFKADSETPFKNEPIISCQATNFSGTGSYRIFVSNDNLYDEDYVVDDGILTINKAPLTVSVNDCTINKGDKIPEFEVIYNSSEFKNGQNESVITYKPYAYTYATEESDPGIYDIIVEGGSSKNYEFRYVNGKLSIIDPSGISDISLTKVPINNVFTLSGILVKQKSEALDNLPKGIYIVNKKKVLAK